MRTCRVPMNFSPAQLLTRVRTRKPIVHHLTNWVTIYDCAQVVKTLGASPVMAHAPEEMADMVQIASALVLNIGTLTTDFVEAMLLAAKAANQLGIPVVLDACGAGATRLRDEQCQNLLNHSQIDIIKGNQSEIARLAGQNVRTRGVDAVEVQSDLVSLARELAKSRNATVVITGKQDLVVSPTSTGLVNNGHELMTSVVGTGCMAASVIGSFAAVEKDHVAAAASALACYEIAAELAAARPDCFGPASFKQHLFDALYALDENTVILRQKLQTQTL